MIMKADGISFCVIFYNLKPYVQETLDSILAQNNLKNYEVLLGDDGSNDGTVELLQEYVNRFPSIFRLFQMPRTSGECDGRKRASSNRLCLLRNAKYKYVYFLDGDDFMVNADFASDAIAFLDAHPNVVGHGSGYQEFLNGELTELHPAKRQSGYITPDSYLPSSYIHASAFVWRNILNEGKINHMDKHGLFSDAGIVLAYMQEGPIYFERKTSFAYRQMEASIWTSHTDIEKAADAATQLQQWLHMAPEYSKLLILQSHHSIRTCFKSRKKLLNLLSKSIYNRCSRTIEKNNDKFMYNLLNWPSISLSSQLWTTFRYLQYEAISKMEQFRIKASTKKKKVN